MHANVNKVTVLIFKPSARPTEEEWGSTKMICFLIHTFFLCGMSFQMQLFRQLNRCHQTQSVCAVCHTVSLVCCSNSCCVWREKSSCVIVLIWEMEKDVRRRGEEGDRLFSKTRTVQQVTFVKMEIYMLHNLLWNVFYKRLNDNNLLLRVYTGWQL